MKITAQKGAVSLEAFLSLVLLFVMMYAMWSTAQLIYQQSRLNTSVQLAAQSSLIEYNRTAARGSGSAIDESEAENVAKGIFQQNFCNRETLIGNIGGQGATCNDPRIVFECAPVPSASSWGDCADSGSLALRVRVEGRAEQQWFVSRVLGGFAFDLQQRTANLRAESVSYAYAAE